MLYSLFIGNKDKAVFKWAHYFPVYERHLKDFINKSVVIFEIGVHKGGSLELWQKYLGPYALIVGIDNKPECAQYEDIHCKICIGDQSDEDFLQSVIVKYGRPDIVIDDGSHMMHDMNTTFKYLYPRLNNNGVYIVEDTHTCYLDNYGGGLGKEDTFIEKSKALIDELHAYYRPDDSITPFTRSTFSICFYDSMVVFEKKLHTEPWSQTIGGSEG